MNLEEIEVDWKEHFYILAILVERIALSRADDKQDVDQHIKEARRFVSLILERPVCAVMDK